MGKIKVIGWVGIDDINYLDDEDGDSIGGCGGFIENGHRWSDYIRRVEEPDYLIALRESIVKNKIRFGANYHQNGKKGIPVFSDGMYGYFSMRAWGDLLAAVWATEENKDYHYMNFYFD